jgi:AraC family transcriptional activator of pobA
MLGSHNFRAILLTSGSATLTLGDTQEPVLAPVFVWAPWTERSRLTIAPGSQGSHLLLGPALLSQALRHNPGAADLGYMAERRYIVGLDNDDASAAAISGCFAGLIAETRETGPMAASMIEAQLAILLISLYRALRAGVQEPDAVVTGRSPLASRFVALIEAHLGERWTVGHFCEALGTSREHLHAVSMRSFGRPPGLMIRQRTMLEARRLLEQSSLSVDQVAQRLGFASAPQFNRFFKTLEGMPPGQYRRRLRRASGSRAPRADLYAWP